MTLTGMSIWGVLMSRSRTWRVELASSHGLQMENFFREVRHFGRRDFRRKILVRQQFEMEGRVTYILETLETLGCNVTIEFFWDSESRQIHERVAALSDLELGCTFLLLSADICMR